MIKFFFKTIKEKTYVKFEDINKTCLYEKEKTLKTIKGADVEINMGNTLKLLKNYMFRHGTVHFCA